VAEINFKDKYYEMIRKELFDYQLISFYKKELKNINKQIDDMSEHISHIENEKKEYDRKIYRMAGVFQKVIDKLIPFKSKRSYLIYKAYSIVTYPFKLIIKIIIKTIKLIFSILLPKKIRRKLDHKIHLSRRISKLMDMAYYPDLPRRKCIKDNDDCILLNNKTTANGKIAVHAHMYYVDLTNEFVSYLRNIPYKFDLYISTMRKKDIPVMYLKFQTIANADKIVIKKSKNSGRDYGPMFVLFGNDLKNYDYILHIHTKKSLRMGSEQAGWRHHLLNGVLGSKEHVMQCFDLMDNHNVGLVYSSTYQGIDFLIYSWILNSRFAKKYFEKCGFEIKDEYLNFSAGSMFWCKTDAIKQLFDLNLEWEDFGDEEETIEGTLAHAIERIFGIACKYNNYDFATFGNDNIFHINDDDYGLKNYTENYLSNTFETLNNFKIITFDVFDTLVTRKVYEPSDVFELIDEKISHTFNIAKGEYKSNRKKAEEILRNKNNYDGEVNIDEIYEEFSRLLNVSTEVSNQIKEMEIETDISLIIPRKDMLVLYNTLKSLNKQLILIADSYYTREIIERILCNCGYLGYYDLLLSSETGFRKDNRTMWNYYYNKYPNINSVHVGDDDLNDTIVVENIIKKPAHHILNGKKVYEISKLYAGSKNNLDNRIIKGLLVNKILFNSPFNLQQNRGVRIEDLKSYGYCLLGPIIFTYFQWLIRNIDKNYNLLFVSREGYFLQKIYNLILDKSSKYNRNPNYYFLISKRAASVPTIETISDIKNILSSYYEGSLKELIFDRLGCILHDNIENKFVNSPRDIDEIIDFVEPFKKEIIFNAGIEKNNYLEYINSLNLNRDNKNCIVDLGYSGTEQYYLSKLMEENIDGAYFLTSDNLKPLALNGKVFSCYNDTIYDGSFSKHAVFKYRFFLEAFLTSDRGKLIKFDENAEPVYMNSGNNIDKLTEIYEGISEFISDISEISNVDIIDLDIDKKYIENQFEKIIKHCVFSEEIINTLKIEDLYSSNSVLNAQGYRNHAFS
jgi:predicted HAD superfamily hydrolase